VDRHFRRDDPGATRRPTSVASKASSEATSAVKATTAGRCTCGTCRGCAQRRRRAWTLARERGLALNSVALAMRLSVREVEELVALQDDWLELKSLRQDTIPAQTALDMFRAEQRRDPGLTRAEVARRMGRTQNQLDRMLGLASTKGSGDPAKRRINIATASALARALGRAPRELDGC
jgi:hypothetical protein